MENKVRELIKEDTLCNNNLQVKTYLANMKKRLKKLGIKDDELSELINDSLETLRIMKRQGQRMEDRLRAYFTAITSLSFERVKRKKRTYATRPTKTSD